MKKYLLLFLVFFNACASSQTKIQSGMEASQKNQILIRFQEKLQELESLNSIQGLAQVKLSTRGRSYSVQEVIQIELPQRFKLESLDDFGGVLFLLKSDGRRLFVQDLKSNQKQLRALSPALIKQFLPFSSDIEQTLGFFFGKIKLLQTQIKKDFILSPEDSAPGRYWISLPGERWLWDEESQQILIFEQFRKKRLSFRYEASHFNFIDSKDGKNLSLPHKIWLKDFVRGSEMQIHYSNLEINPQWEGNPFEVLP